MLRVDEPRLREALEMFKGGVRLLAEDLQAGRLSPDEVAQRLHKGCDFVVGVLDAEG